MPNPPGPGLDESRNTGDSDSDHVADHNTIHELLNNLEISDNTDVDTVTSPPLTGYILSYSTSSGKWTPATGSGGGVTAHSALTGVTSDQHHAKSHAHNGSDGSGSVAHGSLTGIGTDDHHDELHTVASHSDTSATGAELNTLTDGSNADSLHVHTTIGSASFDDLTDVDMTTNAPAAGDLLRFDGSDWVPVDLSALSGSTALPTAITPGVTTNHTDHQEKLHVMFNALMGGLTT